MVSIHPCITVSYQLTEKDIVDTFVLRSQLKFVSLYIWLISQNNIMMLHRAHSVFNPLFAVDDFQDQ